MQRMQRKFGSFLPRSADNAEIATLIAEFIEADKALEALIVASKAWRDAWNDILRFQSNLTHELEVLYMPIVAHSKDVDFQPVHIPAETPRLQMQRVSALVGHYSDLKNDMMQEVQSMDSRIIRPAQDARVGLAPMKKTIKKREDRKLDYERYQSRVDAMDKKSKRSDRDNNALNKHQMDLERSTGEYEAADENLRLSLPPVVNALLSLFPPLLAAQIEIQNTLLAHSYTVLHNYCQDHSLPSPAPELEDIVAEWHADFDSLRMEAEGGLRILSTGKSIHQPMESGTGGRKSYSGLNIRNNMSGSRSSSQTRPEAPPMSSSPKGSIQSQPRPKISASASYRNGAAQPQQPPPVEMSSKPRMGSYSSTTSSNLRTPGDGLIRMASNNSMGGYATPSGTVDREDYFANARPTGTGNPYASTPIVQKKKPPPPPPPKKFQGQPAQYVTALYDFDGQGEGDLSFREGDRIRIVKKTPSEMDWWEGELRGQKGAFPANYCKLV